MYKFGKEPERIQKTDQLTGRRPGHAHRRHARARPGGIFFAAAGRHGAAQRRRRQRRRHRPRDHQRRSAGSASRSTPSASAASIPTSDVEITDAIVAARALPQSKLTAVVSSAELRHLRQQSEAYGPRRRQGARLPGRHAASRRPDAERDRWCSTAGTAGPKSIEIGFEPISGEENPRQQPPHPPGERGERASRASCTSKASRVYEYKFMRRAPRTISRTSNWPACCAPRRTSSTGRDSSEREGAGRRLSRQSRRTCSSYRDSSSAASKRATSRPTQQQLIHDFVDRRGGGLLFLGGRASLSDGGYQNSPLADLIPYHLPGRQRHLPPRLHRPGTDARRRARASSARLDDDPAQECRALEENAADGQLPGSGRRQARRHRAARSPPRRAKRKFPLLVTENYGRGRTVLLRHRRKLALEDVDGPRRQDACHVLAADLSLPGDRHSRTGDLHHPAAGALRRHPACPSAWRCGTSNSSR